MLLGLVGGLGSSGVQYPVLSELARLQSFLNVIGRHAICAH